MLSRGHWTWHMPLIKTRHRGKIRYPKLELRSTGILQEVFLVPAWYADSVNNIAATTTFHCLNIQHFRNQAGQRLPDRRQKRGEIWQIKRLSHLFAGVFWSMVLRKRNLWGGSHNFKTVASGLPLESHLTSVYKRCVLWVHLLRELCEQTWVVGKYLSVADNYNPILQNTVKFRWLFQIASISLWMMRCVDSHSEATSLTWVVKPESHPAMAAAPFMRDTKRPIQFSWYVIIQRMESFCNCSVVGNKRARNIPSYTSS